MGHASAILGADLFVHGGIKSDDLTCQGDWNVFDFGLGIWIKVECKYAS